MNNKKVLFSVIVPLADNTSITNLKNCLDSLKNQKYQNFEIFFVVSNNANSKILQLLKGKKSVKTILKELRKSEARNYGAKYAKGRYLMHIDVNDNPEPEAFREAYELIKNQNAKAIVMQESVFRPHTLIQRIRKLEKTINRKNPYLDTPQIIEAKLFNKIGGFDEELDILDDWGLHFRLKRAGIKFFFLKSTNQIDEVSNLVEVLKRKFQRGSFIPILIKKYPEYQKITKATVLGVYLKNLKLILENPLIFCSLIILKPIEWFFLFLGTLNPASYNLYKEQKEAKDYDKIRTTNYALYKAYCEEKILEEMLNPLPKTALEIGAGTGRITSFLVNKKIKVTPTEPSVSMINEYKKKKGLPKIINMTGQNLSEKLGKFDLVIGLRVIWHIKDNEERDKTFKKAVELSKNSVILDFATKERNQSLLFTPIKWFYSAFFNPNFFIYDHFFSEKEIRNLSKDNNLALEIKFPLEVTIPVWLNLFPKKFSQKIFPLCFKVDYLASKIITPGRYLIKFRKRS